MHSASTSQLALHKIHFGLNVPASPPDVRQGYALPSAFKKISWAVSPLAAASPPDVRQGYALPAGFKRFLGLCPRYGLWPEISRGKARTEGEALTE